MCTTMSPSEAGSILVIAGPLAAAPVIAGIIALVRTTRGRVLAAAIVCIAPALVALAFAGFRFSGGFLNLLAALLVVAGLLWVISLRVAPRPLGSAALAVSSLPLLYLAYFAAQVMLLPSPCG